MAGGSGRVVTGGNIQRVVYLGGLGRSGTTLLERLLGELPGVCSVGEVVHLWQRGIAEAERCGCGEPLPDCPFWRKVGEIAFGGWGQVDVRRVAELRYAFDRNRYIPLLAAPALYPSFRRGVDEYTDYYARIYAAIADASGCPVVVDSSKHASLAFCLRRRAELDLRVIHVVRDSRAVAFSWTRRVVRMAVERPEQRPAVAGEGGRADNAGALRGSGDRAVCDAGQARRFCRSCR